MASRPLRTWCAAPMHTVAVQVPSLAKENRRDLQARAARVFTNTRAGDAVPGRRASMGRAHRQRPSAGPQLAADGLRLFEPRPALLRWTDLALRTVAGDAVRGRSRPGRLS